MIKKIKKRMICSKCGGENVVRDAWAEWNMEDQKWDLHSVYDNCFCRDCNEDTHIKSKDK